MAVNIVDGTGPVGGPMRDAFDLLSVVGVVLPPGDRPPHEKGRSVTHRAWYIGIAGAVLLAVGLFALRFPVLLDVYDQWGWQVECGNGFSADLTQADAAGQDLVDQCDSALLARRSWTIPLALIGLTALLAVLVAAIRTPEHKSLVPGRSA
jgi:hypothetical protein